MPSTGEHVLALQKTCIGIGGHPSGHVHEETWAALCSSHLGALSTKCFCHMVSPVTMAAIPMQI